MGSLWWYWQVADKIREELQSLGKVSTSNTARSIYYQANVQWFLAGCLNEIDVKE